MIYTRFGSVIKEVTWFDERTGQVACLVERAGGCIEPRTYHVSDLKADGGIKTIVDAAIYKLPMAQPCSEG